METSQSVRVLHPEYKLVGMDGTSRVYSSNPSVSQIPKIIRYAVIPYSHKKFLYADLKAAEVYILVKWAKCQTLIDAYESGQDLYLVITRAILKKEEVTKEERDTIKAVVLSILYGSEGLSASKLLHIEESVAKGFVDAFFSAYPEIKRFQETVWDYVSEHSYTQTFYFRPRIFNLEADELGVKRQAVNTAIQGTCADCLKMCIGEISSDKCRFITSVFDSILLEVDKDMTREQAKELLSDIFSHCQPFNFKFEFGMGNSWGEAQADMQ